MAITAKELLAIAAAEIGYHEKETNAQLDNPTANAGDGNWTKFARDLRAAGYYNGNKNGYAWCDVFVDWCFFQLCGKDKAKAESVQCQTGTLGAGCGYSARYYKNQGRFFTSDPKPGDQIFFGTSSSWQHTGIVEKVTSSTVTIIEGNSDNKVERNTYKLSYKRILGYGRPKLEAEPVETVKPVKPTTSSGKIELGKTVAFKSDVTTYYPGGPKFKDWVKKDYYHVVTQVTSNGKPVIKGGKVCVLLGKKLKKGRTKISDGINTWVAIDNLELVGGTVSGSGATNDSETSSAVTLYPDAKADYAKSFASSKAGAYKVVASGGLYLRTGASESKKAIELMKNGSRVKCYGYYTGGWLYVVSANGKKGFCHSSYLVKV